MTLTDSAQSLVSIETVQGVVWLRFNRSDTLNAVSTAALSALAAVPVKHRP